MALAVGCLTSGGPGIASADGHGATASGGHGAIGNLFQQNIAQEHRQNNNCANPNTVIVQPGGPTATRCATGDASFNKRTVTKGGDAKATGGSGLVSHLVQQNTAQKGRQNNNCGNPNDTLVSTGGSLTDSFCSNQNHSRNEHSATKGGGAKATGGSGLVSHLVQQNTAQEGRQNNNCGSRNGLTVITSGGAQTQCVAVDKSRNIGTVHR
ncbi:hypothetical protein [Streptomyces sp. KR55]|uniref:hypothetical protein n=1 Tax=Streptomyces sp. KR55 TaxID=3457425 RepID=UPI003FD49FD2